MDWLLDNFAKLLPVILAVLYFWVTSKKRRPGAEEAEEVDGSDEAERARRIQEEIRRRILERQRGDSPGPHVEPPVMVEDSLHQPQTRQVRPVREKYVREAVPEPFEDGGPQTNYQDVLERQARLAERFEEAQRLAEAQKSSRMTTLRQTTSPKRRGARPASAKWAFNPLRADLLRDLKGRTGLKRAILLREVLGEPVGVRQGPLPQK